MLVSFVTFIHQSEHLSNIGVSDTLQNGHLPQEVSHIYLRGESALYRLECHWDADVLSINAGPEYLPELTCSEQNGPK